MPSNIEQCLAESLKLREDMEREFLNAQVELGGDFYGDVVESSPVLHGGYRASHVMAIGDGVPQENIYEVDSRPPSDEEYIGPILDPPDVGSARAAAAGALEFGDTLWVENSRYYATQLEYGTALMEPRLIYEGAHNRIATKADAAAAALSAQRVG